MADLDIVQTRTTDMSNQLEDYSVPTETTDGATDQKETEYMNTEWTQQFGYYRNIPELRAVIDAKATWTVGKGYQADEINSFKLNLITGFGVDTFNTVLENMIRTYQIGGDAFAENIRRKDNFILNLKPLNPGVIKTIANRKGIIIRYEQIDRTTKKTVKKFQPEDIFHLSRNRVADEIHGQSMVSVLSNIILMKNEAMTDYKKVMHRNVFPRFIFKANTDNPTKLAILQNQIDKTIKNYEHLLLPAKTMEHEIMAIPPNATLNPLAWLNYLDDKFYEAAGVPRIVVGGTGAITEAAVKIAYLAYQQTIEEEQLYIEEQVKSQLGLTINLEFPASLENELLSDKAKDGPVNVQPNETTAGSGQ